MTSKWEEAELQKLIKNPKELTFNDLKTLLGQYGYILARSRGSHFIFHKTDAPSITIPSHHNLVKKWYVKYVCKIILATQSSL